MKKLYTLLLIQFLMLALVMSSEAQLFPVQVNTQLTPPYSPFLADYTAAGSQRLTLHFRLNDVNFVDYNVKLRLTIEGVGITIRTKQTFIPQPITLQGGGIPTILYGEDISEYFNPNNLDFAGFTRREYESTGKIPEGVYRFSVEVLDYNRNIVVSNKGTTVAWMILNDPPLLNLPRNDTKVRILDPTNIAFTWTPRHTGSPNSAFSTEYNFKLVEIWPANRNPYDAFLSQPALYEVTTTQSQIVYGLAEPALIPGRKYAWQVQATDTDGRDLFKNQGRSEVYVFQFGDELGVPENLRKETANAATMALRWEASTIGEMPDQYRVRYKPANSDKWLETISQQSWTTLTHLTPNTGYDVQVRGERQRRFGEYTVLQRMNTADEVPAGNYSCGTTVNLQRSDTTGFLLELAPGDVFSCADFKVVVAQAKKIPNGFTGTGLMQINMLNGASVEVNFYGSINREYRLTSGSVESTYEKGSDMGRVIEELDKIGEEKKEEPKPKADSTDVPRPIDIIYAGVIDSVYVNADGKIEVIDEEGTVTTYEPKKDPATGEVQETVIADKNGDQWVVQKDPITGETTVTKVEGGAVTPGNNAVTTRQQQHIKALALDIAKAFRKELGEVLNLPLNAPKLGAGPISADVYIALPSCMSEYENDRTALRAIFDYTGELQTNTTLQDRLVALLEKDADYTSVITKNQNIFEKNTSGFDQLLSAEDWNKAKDESCEHQTAEAKRLYISDYLVSLGLSGECFMRGLAKGLLVPGFQTTPLVGFIEAGLCLTEKNKCAGEDYWTQFSYGATNALLQELDIISIAQGVTMLIGSQLKNNVECVVKGGSVNVILTASTVEERLHMFSKCVIGIDMTLEEWKAMYSKVSDYVAANWTDPYLHGQATVFVATIVIPFSKISALSKVKLLNKFKTSSKLNEFGSKVDELEKLRKVADEGGDVGKVVDELTLAKGGAKTPKLGEKLNVSDYATSAKNSAKDLMTPDHIPSHASTKKYMESKLGRELTVDEAKLLRDEGTTLLYETELHQKFSRTYGGRNTADQILNDSKNLFEAANKDLEALRKPLLESGMTTEEINQAFGMVHEMNRKKGLY